MSGGHFAGGAGLPQATIVGEAGRGSGLVPLSPKVNEDIMLLHIIARGRIGRGPEAELVERYMKRVTWAQKISELPDTGGRVPAAPVGRRDSALAPPTASRLTSARGPTRSSPSAAQPGRI